MPACRLTIALTLLVSCPLAIAVAGGKTVGDRTGRMKAEIKLTKAAVGKGRRILFLGNSITLHGPAPKIGWTSNWGMAASAQEKDYVHVLVDSIAKRSGIPPVVRVGTIVDFERHYDTYDPEAGLKKDLDFKPDVVVVAIGENVPGLASAEAKAKYEAAFLRLLKVLRDSGRPEIFVRSCFWPNKAKDDIMRKSCQAVGGVFVDIGGLAKDESNYARSERKFIHAGVAAHPGDKGMKAIADALLKAMEGRVRKEGQGKVRAPGP